MFIERIQIKNVRTFADGKTTHSSLSVMEQPDGSSTWIGTTRERDRRRAPLVINV